MHTQDRGESQCTRAVPVWLTHSLFFVWTWVESRVPIRMPMSGVSRDSISGCQGGAKTHLWAAWHQSRLVAHHARALQMGVAIRVARTSNETQLSCTPEATTAPDFSQYVRLLMGVLVLAGSTVARIEPTIGSSSR